MKEKVKRLKEREYTNLEIKLYLTEEGELSKEEMKNVFKLRTRSLDIGAFKPYKYKTAEKCQLGYEKVEDLRHIFKKCHMFFKKCKMPLEKVNIKVFGNSNDKKIKEN